MSLKNKTIGFIGGGNMAEALITGLLESGQCRASHISVAEPRAARRRGIKRRFGVCLLADNKQLVRRSNVIVLAVKPQVMAAVLKEIRTNMTKQHLIISIAAGVDTRLIARHLGRGVRLVRAMPNTPALIGRGIAGLYASKAARAADLKVAQALFASVGQVVVFKRETQLDWVTALSGSGPAYVFLFLEALIEAGVKGGLNHKQARELALATAEGATALAKQQAIDLKTLRQRVTSKGGTTEAALKVLQQKKWSPALQAAVRAAARRAEALRKS